jgi:serine/threonine-protein kinase
MSYSVQPTYAPGAIVGGYRIESLIAHGGMGHVYLATGPDGAEVALKLLKRDLVPDAVARRRFEREAEIAMRIDHPRVVPVLDIGEHDGLPFLAQRYVHGGTLADKIDREGPLKPADAVAICLDVAGALDALHAVGLVHRDLKPANILLDEREVAYITDFGLAKDHHASVLTRPGQALGSLDYMAPEQIRADTVGATTDVYGLGCVMFTCLAGVAPFADKHGTAVLWAHLQDQPANPVALRPDVPDAIGEAVLRALAKEPEDRPQTATEFALELQAAAE